jgi:hypothetical protein
MLVCKRGIVSGTQQNQFRSTRRSDPRPLAFASGATADLLASTRPLVAPRSDDQEITRHPQPGQRHFPARHFEDIAEADQGAIQPPYDTQ